MCCGSRGRPQFCAGLGRFYIVGAAVAVANLIRLELTVSDRRKVAMLAKLLSAVALTVLASTQSLLVELAKSRNGGATPFDTPSAVFFTELLKLLIALGLWLRERPSLEMRTSS